MGLILQKKIHNSKDWSLDLMCQLGQLQMTLGRFLSFSESVYSESQFAIPSSVFQSRFSKYLFNVFMNEHPFFQVFVNNSIVEVSKSLPGR